MNVTRSLIAVAAILIVAGPSATAQKAIFETIEPAVRPAGAPDTVGALIRKKQEAVRTSVVSVEWTSDSFIIPVAGNAAGSGGTYFRSDVSFNNDRDTAQRIAVGWMAQGQNNCTAPLMYFSLPADSVTIVDDFVGQNLGKSGLGALLVLAVLSNGSLDEDGEIDGYSRIWTPQPGSSGTTSQNFAAIDVQDSIGSLPANLMGLKQSSQYRTNVGIVNLDTEAAHNWTFTSIFNGRVTSLSVQPCSMSQAGATANSASASGNLAFTVRSDGFGFWWSGYGSSTDNVTGDGWVARAIQ